jgi:hypothetical protein
MSTVPPSGSPEALPRREFLLNDYELKIRYLTDQFSRMWTRFNYFVTIESALVGGKFVFGNGNITPQLAIIGAGVSLIWYVMGAEDRFLVRVYRKQVEDAAALVAHAEWPTQQEPYRQEPYCAVGEIEHTSNKLKMGVSGWRWDPISTTHLAALIPLTALCVWLAAALVLTV